MTVLHFHSDSLHKIIPVLIESLPDATEYVHYTADADIDADGANGQNGYQPAYRINNKFEETGLDLLKHINIGIDSSGHFYKLDPTQGINAILDNSGFPVLFPDGIIASATSLRYPGIPLNHPEAYINSAEIAYIAVPSDIITKTTGIVLGCRAQVTYKGNTISCVVADSSGSRIGELSIAAAILLGMSGSPLHGGEDSDIVKYELWPGQQAEGFKLQPS